MLKLFLTIFFSFNLFAFTPTNLTPKTYALLGNNIYNNLDDIEKLSKMSLFKDEKTKMNDYIVRSNKCKSEGFFIDSGDNKYSVNEYYKSLKALSAQNDEYVKLANIKFLEVMETNNTKLFIDLVQLAIIDKVNISDKLKNFISLHVSELQDTQYYKNYINRSNNMPLNTPQLSKNDEDMNFSDIETLREEDKQSQELLRARLELMLAHKKELN